MIESSSGYASIARRGETFRIRRVRDYRRTAGIYLINSSDTIINNGTIEGTNGAVFLEGGTVRLRNEASGLIRVAYGVRLVTAHKT